MANKNTLLLLVALIVAYLITSAIFMALWNDPVKGAFGQGIIQKITYPQALGLVLFISLFFGGSSYIVMNKMN